VLECVVVGEPGTCADLAGSGARCVSAPDDAGLDAALAVGAAHRERSARGTCFLVADLPLATPESLGAALALVPQDGTGVVRDAYGSGTVLLARRPGAPRPHFGPGSGRRHLRCGATDLSDVVDQRLRRDLDVWDDLVSSPPRPGSHLQAWHRGVPCVRREAHDDLVAAAPPR
jgi:2-phospho-L-lactate guanylyltransferase